MRNVRVLGLLLGLSVMNLSRATERAEKSAKRLNSALITVKQPQKKAAVKFKSKNKHSTKFKSTKPIKSKVVSVFRNKSNI